MNNFRRARKFIAIPAVCVLLLVVIQAVRAAESYHKLIENEVFTAEADVNTIRSRMPKNGLEVFIKMRMTPKVFVTANDGRQITKSLDSVRALCHADTLIVERSELYGADGKLFMTLTEPKVLQNPNDAESIITISLTTLCGTDLKKAPIDLPFSDPTNFSVT